MPGAARTLTRPDVAEIVATEVFAPGAGGQVGVELEWVAVPAPGMEPPAPDDVRAALPDPLPGRSRVTFEPGGQLELSGPAAPDLPAALAAMAVDVNVAHDAATLLGCALLGTGLDSSGSRERVVDAPRYRAMEEYFDAHWPAGRTMMRHTAAIQVNVDNGPEGDIAARWRRAHDLGPVLVAAFANSPFDAAGRITGWCSTRFAVWQGIDASRTGSAHEEGVDPVSAYTRYALDARVMMCWPDGPDGDAAVPRPELTFGDWIDHGNAFGHPTADDLAYHLTTLFPPVRPRGWLELRMIDGLPAEWWSVPVALTTALLDDHAAASAVEHALGATRGQWTVAARCGLADPMMRRVAAACFDAARNALPRLGADAGTLAAVDEYRRRYVDRGRSPAHDRIDERIAEHAAPRA
jgi:glutamate--cysteine ligase